MLFMILLIGHMIADFFLQSSKMAEGKKTNIKVLLAHSCIYFIIFALITLVCIQLPMAVLATLIIAGVHFIIDLIRAKIDNHFKSSGIQFATFLMDQILHFTTITLIYYLLNLSVKTNSIYSSCESYSQFNKIILCGFLFVMLMDPSAVFVKKVFAFLFKDEINSNAANNAGSTIGKLERIITAILLLCDQYGVIGLVLTAKSIARFKKLEDQDFAEKYLTGTLLSLSISLIATLATKYALTL